ncbi:MAG: excinuclease ABC subunit A, partial [Bacteroidota bacterium]|nr:excinuclease ABC subunit A [Bacteroidota bacterium]
MHNLKNVSVKIPRNKIVVFSGLSGSGKSSLAFDTLFAEGQRRYVESLSSYARQFLGRLNKPKVDSIDGISPAISIEQKVITNNPRSTVGTSTEIYDYLKLLFSRVGKTYSPISGNLVKKHYTTDVINYIKTISNGEKLLIISPIKKTKNSSLVSKLDYYKNQGFARLFVKDRIIRIEDFDSKYDEDLYLVVDRIIVENNDAFYNRTSESIETAFSEGNGIAIIQNIDNNNKIEFSNRFSLDGMNFIEPNEHLFSFNNPMGAC